MRAAQVLAAALLPVWVVDDGYRPLRFCRRPNAGSTSPGHKRTSAYKTSASCVRGCVVVVPLLWGKRVRKALWSDGWVVGIETTQVRNGSADFVLAVCIGLPQYGPGNVSPLLIHG